MVELNDKERIGIPSYQKTPKRITTTLDFKDTKENQKEERIWGHASIKLVSKGSDVFFIAEAYQIKHTQI